MLQNDYSSKFYFAHKIALSILFPVSADTCSTSMEELPLRLNHDDRDFEVDEREYLLQPSDSDLDGIRYKRWGRRQRWHMFGCLKRLFCG